MDDYKVLKLADRWTELNSKKSGVLSRAENASKLTIPSVFPVGDLQEDASLPEIYQSLGARACLNLSSKISQNLVPPTSIFFKLMINKELEAQILSGQNPTVMDEINSRMFKLETAIMNQIERWSIRNYIYEAIKLLIVTGNACLWFDKVNDTWSVFNLRNFSVTRDTSGRIIEVIIKETKDRLSFPPEMDLPEGTDKELNVYTRMFLNEEGGYTLYQSVENVFVEGSEQKFPKGAPLPILVLRWTNLTGSSYGRGLVEHYIGDLRNYEAVNMALVDTASVLSRIVFLVSPVSQYGTDVKKLNEAITGDFIAGHADDITVPDVGKVSDMNVLISYMDKLESRIAQAFLLFQSRQAERVTAEEIRQVAQQLEEALGGSYSLLSEDLQKPLVQLAMDNLDIKLESIAEPLITTGITALGRGNDANKLMALSQWMASNPAFQRKINTDVLTERVVYSLGITADGLLYTQEELSQMASQSQEEQLGASFGASLAESSGASLGASLTGQ